MSALWSGKATGMTSQPAAGSASTHALWSRPDTAICSAMMAWLGSADSATSTYGSPSGTVEQRGVHA
jgi:hypothetical protein